MYKILKSELVSPTKFRRTLNDLINDLTDNIKNTFGINFDYDEFGNLLLSTCRVNEMDIINRQAGKLLLDDTKVWNWVKSKLIPNLVIVGLDDEDVVRLLLFCIEITYQMFTGGTKATISQKGFRERRRTFESILVDQFVGKLGEIIVKKYLEKEHNVKIELDWEISTDIEKYRNDIMNAKKNVSIKSSPALAGIWAEADLGYDYGIMVKCFIPQPTILQFFIEVCGFSRLLDFTERKIPNEDNLFKGYLSEIRKRIENYKCGKVVTQFKGFICGYFKTSTNKIVNEGQSLEYLGVVRQKRYFERIDKLKYRKEDWQNALKDMGLIKTK